MVVDDDDSGGGSGVESSSRASSSMAGQSSAAFLLAAAAADDGDESQSCPTRWRTGEPAPDERLDDDPERVRSGEHAMADDEADELVMNEWVLSWRVCGAPKPNAPEVGTVGLDDDAAASEASDDDEGPPLRLARRWRRLCGASLKTGGAWPGRSRMPRPKSVDDSKCPVEADAGDEVAAGGAAPRSSLSE